MFVGRDRELDALDAALARLSSNGSLYLITGEPGIGKTRLASELVEHARERGIRATWGQCWEAGGAPAFWPWREACEEVGIKFPDPAAIANPDPSEARFALFRDVASLLGREAARAPFVVVFEDLHAADRSTLLLLEFIAPQLRTLPILVIGTYRDLEASLIRTPLVRSVAPVAAVASSSSRDYARQMCLRSSTTPSRMPTIGSWLPSTRPRSAIHYSWTRSCATCTLTGSAVVFRSACAKSFANALR